MNAEGAGMPATLDPNTLIQQDGAGELLNPFTGELIDRTDMTQVARVIEQLREHRDQVNTALAAFTQAVIERSIMMGTKTIHLGALTLEVSPDYEVEWDISMLNTDLPDAGVPDGRMAELLTTTVTWKVNARIAKQMAGANPDYAKIIEAAQTRVPKRQYVTVKR